MQHRRRARLAWLTTREKEEEKSWIHINKLQLYTCCDFERIQCPDTV
jgi:hypothetical protein